MIGSLMTRGLVLMFGYAYPAYECYKSIELNKPDIEQLRFWCQYWILVAGLTVCERIADTFIGWVPMYGEAKLAFFIYLWFPKTKGTRYVYDSFFKPYVKMHEPEIDRSLLELKTRAGDIALLYWQKAASYVQTRTFDILQYIASQSTAKRPAQPQDQGNGVQKPAATPQPQNGEQPSPTSTTSASEQQEDAKEAAGPSADPAPAALSKQKTTPTKALVESSKTLKSNEEPVKVMQIDSVPPSANETAQPSAEDAPAEEARRLTRATRSRRTMTRVGSDN